MKTIFIVSLLLLTIFFVHITCWLFPGSSRHHRVHRNNRFRSTPQRRHPIGLKHRLAEASKLFEYNGPISTFENIEHGFSIPELGIDLMMGTSTIPNAGYGLFIALSEDVFEATLPIGTILCGYSKQGEFRDRYEATKSVAFAFDTAETLVVYNKKLVKLADVLRELITKLNMAKFDNQEGSLSSGSLLLGHSVYWESNSSNIIISPDVEYKSRYFIPADVAVPTIECMGIYANDLAFNNMESQKEEQYEDASTKLNGLSIVWRMALSDSGCLVPSWPVVITQNDITLTNEDPMELGIRYSWRYWQSTK